MKTATTAQAWVGALLREGAITRRAHRNVLLAIADRCDDNHSAAVLVSDIARELWMSDRQVRRILQDLAAAGHLTIERRKSSLHQGYIASRYTLNVSDLVDGEYIEPVREAVKPDPAPIVVHVAAQPAPAPEKPVAPTPSEVLTLETLKERLASHLEEADGDQESLVHLYEHVIPASVQRYHGLNGLGTGSALYDMVVFAAARAYGIEVPEDDKAAKTFYGRIRAARKQHGVKLISAFADAGARATGDALSYAMKIASSNDR